MFHGVCSCLHKLANPRQVTQLWFFHLSHKHKYVGANMQTRCHTISNSYYQIACLHTESILVPSQDQTFCKIHHAPFSGTVTTCDCFSLLILNLYVTFFYYYCNCIFYYYRKCKCSNVCLVVPAALVFYFIAICAGFGELSDDDDDKINTLRKLHRKRRIH